VEIGVADEVRVDAEPVADDPAVPEEQPEVVVVAVAEKAGRARRERVPVEVSQDPNLVVAAGVRHHGADFGIRKGVLDVGRARRGRRRLVAVGIRRREHPRLDAEPGESFATDLELRRVGGAEREPRSRALGRRRAAGRGERHTDGLRQAS